MRDVYVLGVGQTFFGKQPQFQDFELGAQAAHEAIMDSGVNVKDLERAYCGSVYGPPTGGQAALIRCGVNSLPVYDVENGCTSGSSAVDLLWRDIAYCGTECGIAIGMDSMTNYSKKIGGKGLIKVDGDLHGEQGMSTVSYFAGVATLLMEERGATLEDLAFPAVKNHQNGSKNPLAQYRKVFTTEDILASPMIVEPLTALMMCPQSDGAAAVVLCSKEYYDKHNTHPERPAVKIAASVIQAAGLEDAEFDQLVMDNLITACNKAYEMAGVTPKDLDVVEMHDAFANEEYTFYEMAGLCEPGKAIEFARSGATTMKGSIPVNPSGGLMSMGHPLGASGVRVVGDVAKQLWGIAGENQVKDAKIGMAEMLGGLSATVRTSPIAGVQILTKE